MLAPLNVQLTAVDPVNPVPAMVSVFAVMVPPAVAVDGVRLVIAGGAPESAHIVSSADASNEPSPIA